MEIWETIGLWQYSVPGLYLFAQFCLGVLVALGNLVNSSVFCFLSDGNEQSLPADSAMEGELWISYTLNLSLLFLIIHCPHFLTKMHCTYLFGSMSSFEVLSFPF